MLAPKTGHQNPFKTVAQIKREMGQEYKPWVGAYNTWARARQRQNAKNLQRGILPRVPGTLYRERFDNTTLTVYENLDYDTTLPDGSNDGLTEAEGAQYHRMGLTRWLWKEPERYLMWYMREVMGWYHLSVPRNIKTEDFVTTVLQTCCLNDSLVEVERYLQQVDEDIDHENFMGHTTLWYYIAHMVMRKWTENGPKIVRLLLIAGANPNTVDHHFTSALHLAAIAGREMVLSYLLEWDALVNIKTVTGSTPFNYAIYGNQPGSLECAKQLIYAGASLTIFKDRAIKRLVRHPHFPTTVCASLLEYLRQPPQTLKACARVVVRQQLLSAHPQQLRRNAFKLEIPQTLQHYLLFRGELNHLI